MYLDSGGRVGMGTTSPSANLDIRGSTAYMTAGNGTVTAFVQGDNNQGAAKFGSLTNYPMAMMINNGEVARFDTSGNLGIATSSPQARLHVSMGSNIYIQDGGAAGWSGNPMIRNPAGSGYLVMLNGTGGGVGLSNNATSWTAISDERHKTNLVPIENGLAKVMQLRAVTGRYVLDNDDVSRAFLIAQDVLAVLPEAVDTSDSERYGLAYTEVIPLLVASIKELSTQLTELKAEVATLKGV
jgi:hypothetical protein